MAVAADIPTSMTVSYRCANSVSDKASEATPERTEPWTLVGMDSVMSASPWRTFRWHRGQRHYSGSFWSATERDLVIYESRLELARLLFADFDRSVQRILAQPFLLRAEVAGALRKHVPDYLLLTSTGPVVVDVKPQSRATKPDNMFVFGWTRQAVESRGWRYEVWSEPLHAELENVRFLAGYRRDWLFDHELLAELRAADLDGTHAGSGVPIYPGSTEGDNTIRGPASAVATALHGRSNPPVERQPRVEEGGVSNAAVRVGVGTRFSYDGEFVEVVELVATTAGNEVVLKNVAGQQIIRVSVRELLTSDRARIIPALPGPSADDPQELASVLLAELTDAERQQLRERAAHVREVLTGYRSGLAELAAEGEPRREFEPSLPLTTRYRSKAAELNVTMRTVQQWVADFHSNGEAGLLPKRDLATNSATGRVDQRWVETALEVMVEHTAESKPSRTLVIDRTNARVVARFGPDVVKPPSRATAFRVLEELERRHPTFRLSTKRNRDIADRPDETYGKLRPTRPGEYVLMDTTRLDVFALDPVTLRWINSELTVAMDWYDRCIVGLRLTPVSTKSVDAASVLYQAFRPRPAGRDWPAHAVWPEHGIPRSVLLDTTAIERPGVSSPAVVPETIVVDHGKIYVSEHLTSVCCRMGISIQPARLRTGRDKGPVERFFRTLREDLLQALPGYKGPDIHSRGLNPEGDAFFFLDELETIIREWVATVYHHKQHSSLVDPNLPKMRMSPAVMFEHGVARAGYIEVPRDPDLGYEFLKTEWRTIQHYGVEIDGRRYNAPILKGKDNQTSPYTGKAKGRWPIQVNPDDITRAYFRDLDSRQWHTLAWEHAPALDMPLSEDALQFARKLAATKYTYPDDKIAVADLFERWNVGLGQTLPERRMALRLSREQVAIDLPEDTPEQAVSALPSVARVLAATPTAGDAPPNTVDEPVAEMGDDDADDLEALDTEDDFYADALEDV